MDTPLSLLREADEVAAELEQLLRRAQLEGRRQGADVNALLAIGLARHQLGLVESQITAAEVGLR